MKRQINTPAFNTQPSNQGRKDFSKWNETLNSGSRKLPSTIDKGHTIDKLLIIEYRKNSYSTPLHKNALYYKTNWFFQLHYKFGMAFRRKHYFR